MPAMGPGVDILAGPEWTRDQILGVVAHEIAHVLNALDSDFPVAADASIHQGLASWAAGRYWASMLGFNSLADAVRASLNDGRYIALETSDEMAWQALPSQDAESTSQDCIAIRDTLYTEWAAFIDYLILSRGRDRFIALLDSGTTSVEATPIDYAGTYGMSLQALEREWLAALAAGDE
jgi:hypothetical protein